MFKEALQIAEKREKQKSKEKGKDASNLMQNFKEQQGEIKKAITEQCKEIEENNRMFSIRDLFKKIEDTKGTFHAKMATIKDRNGKELTETEEIKKRWQEYTEELYKKILITWITTIV